MNIEDTDEQTCDLIFFLSKTVGSKKQLRFSRSMDDEERKGSGEKRNSSAHSRKSASTLSSHPATPLSINGVGAVQGRF